MLILLWYTRVHYIPQSTNIPVMFTIFLIFRKCCAHDISIITMYSIPPKHREIHNTIRMSWLKLACDRLVQQHVERFQVSVDDHGIEGMQIAHGSGSISTHLDLLRIDLEQRNKERQSKRFRTKKRRRTVHA